MRLVPTVLPSNPLRWRPSCRLSLGTTAVVLLAMLGACASGDIEDARRGAAVDLDATPDLAAEQATHTAQLFKPGTPGPTEAARRPTTLEALVITLDLGPGNAPRDQYSGVPSSAGTVYADALLRNLRGGQIVSVEWVSESGILISSSSIEVGADAAQAWVAMPLQLGGLTPGDYAAFINVDDTALNSIVFRVSAPGSAAQVLNPLPANPQVSEEDDTAGSSQPENGGAIEPGGPGQDNAEGPVIVVTETP